MTREITTNASVQEAIQEAVRDFMNMVSKADAAGIARRYSNDAVVMPPNHDFVKGRSSIEGFWRQMFNTGAKRLQLDIEKVEDYGDIVTEIGRYTVYSEQDEPVDDGKYLVLWRQENGEWKLFRDIWNSSRTMATG
jgi:uncharacterized protein (TIGR02246 family)